MPTIQTSRLTMHYHSHGLPPAGGRGLTLLLLHGSFGSARWWLPLMELLPDEIYAIAPDLRGCGQSEKPGSGYEIESQAADVAAFVAAMGLGDVDVAAHAGGAAIAVEFLLAHPEAARTLVLINPAPVEGVFTPLEALTLLHQMSSDPTLLRRAMALLAPRLAAEDDPLFEQIVEDAAAMDPAAFAENAVALNQWNRLAQAKQLTLPTLLLWGDEDPFVSRDSMTRTLLAIPGAANLDVLRGIGHSPMLEEPLALAERIVDFLNEDMGGFAAIRGRALHD